MKFAIIQSEFNAEVTRGLYQGAIEALNEQGIKAQQIVHFLAPGAFEMPLLAQTLAQTGQYAGVICLGCVIKGDTAHFEFISLGAAIGIQQASLNSGVPIAFGVLTTYDDDQAVKRSRPDHENKGREAALACLRSARMIQAIRIETRSSSDTAPSAGSQDQLL